MPEAIMVGCRRNVTYVHMGRDRTYRVYGGLKPSALLTPVTFVYA